MKNTLIIAGIVGLVAHLVSGLGTATVSASDATDTVLIYEVAPNGATADVAAPDMDKILKAINHRLNSGLKKLAQVRKLNDQRIEVVLMDPNGKDRQHIEGLLSRPGTLEFRILANNRDNKDIDRRGPEGSVKGRGARFLRQAIGLVGAGEGSARKRVSRQHRH